MCILLIYTGCSTDKLNMNSVYLKYNNFDSLDPSRLEQLVNLGKDIEEDVLDQLIKIHKETSDLILIQMHELIAFKNFDEIKRCAHKFKSSSGNLGLMRLNQLCSDLETYLNKTESIDLVAVTEFVEGIQYEYAQTNQKLNSYQKVA